MDRRRLIIGGSLMLIIFGLILLSFTKGGVFNPIIPYISLSERAYQSGGHGHRPDLAYRDLTREGPMTGLVLLAVGAIGLIYSWALKAPD